MLGLVESVAYADSGFILVSLFFLDYLLFSFFHSLRLAQNK